MDNYEEESKKIEDDYEGVACDMCGILREHHFWRYPVRQVSDGSIREGSRR